MTDQYPLRLTFGQTLFGILCLIILGFTLFYLGARFGPELLWGLNLDRFRENPLLPETLSDNDLEVLLKEESNKNMIFNKYLESDTGVVFRSGIPEQVEEIHEDVIFQPIQKSIVKPIEKPKEKPLEAVLSEALQKPPPPPVKVLDKQGSFMQLGSFFSEEEATRFAGKLAKQGIPARADNLMQNGGKYYLNLGPFPDEESMHQAKKQIKQNYGMNATAFSP